MAQPEGPGVFAPNSNPPTTGAANLPPGFSQGGGQTQPIDYSTQYQSALMQGAKPDDPALKELIGHLSPSQKLSAENSAQAAQAAAKANVTTTPMDAGAGMPNRRLQANPDGTKGFYGQTQGADWIGMPGQMPQQAPQTPSVQAPTSTNPSMIHGGRDMPDASEGKTIAQKVQDAWDYMHSNSGPSGMGSAGWKNWAELLIKGLGGIGDAFGASKLAYSGVQSPTRLQQEYKMRLASQQQANQQQAALTAGLAKIDPETDAAIRKAIREQDNQALANIAEYKGINPYAIDRIYKTNIVNYLASKSPAINEGSAATPEQAGQLAATGAQVGP